MTRLALVLAVLAAALGGCQPGALLTLVENAARPGDGGNGDDVPPPDDVVDVHVGFCARPADDVAFPRKIVLAVDMSAAAGQAGDRAQAVRDFVDSLRGQPSAFIATVGFGGNVYTEPEVTSQADPLFEPASQWVEPAFLGSAAAADHGDLDALLSAAHSLILLDMLRTDAAELARTQYTVVVLSDGNPTPRCCTVARESVGTLDAPFGCAGEPYEIVDANARYCEGEREAEFCNDVDALDAERARLAAADAAIGRVPDFGEGALVPLAGLDVDGDYNTEVGLEAKVGALVDLGRAFGTAGVTVDTVLFFPAALSDEEKAAAGLSRCRSEGLMQRLAFLGGGEFVEALDVADLSLLSLDVSPPPNRFVVADAFVRDENARPGALPDSDGDGLADDDDAAPSSADADDDGFGDAIEALVPGASPPDCPVVSLDFVDRQDIDGDGLNGCEEQFLGTDVKNADTDGDGVMDGLELRTGLNPVIADGNLDIDFDGAPNLVEVRDARDPRVADDDATATQQTRRIDGDCGVIDARVHIADTLDGTNRLVAYLVDVPVVNPNGRKSLRIACADVTFVAGQPPPSVTLDAVDFLDLGDPTVLDALANGTSPCSPLSP